MEARSPLFIHYVADMERAVRVASFRDPEGNGFDLRQEVAG